jgi:hypothetical protein
LVSELLSLTFLMCLSFSTRLSIHFTFIDWNHRFSLAPSGSWIITYLLPCLQKRSLFRSIAYICSVASYGKLPISSLSEVTRMNHVLFVWPEWVHLSFVP